ncbi:hypothetical protein Tco_0900021 [Tanacetum coccineum]
MIQDKEMMQDKDLKNSKSNDKGSRSRSQSMNEQSIKTRQDHNRQSIKLQNVISSMSSGGSGYHQKDRKPSQNDKTEHGMEKTVQNQGQSPKMPKSESILKNTIECNLNPSDGPGKPNSISMKTVKTKWALNQLQQPICVQLTKTVKTLKAQS